MCNVLSGAHVRGFAEQLLSSTTTRHGLDVLRGAVPLWVGRYREVILYILCIATLRNRTWRDSTLILEAQNEYLNHSWTTSK